MAAAYAGWASGTVPFTTSADVAVSIPAALLAAGLVAEWLAPAGGTWRRLPAPARQAGRDDGHDGRNGRNGRDWGSLVPWMVLVAVVVAVELASYFHGGSRSLYPTISSSAEELFRHRWVKAAAFFGWMGGCWCLVRR